MPDPLQEIGFAPNFDYPLGVLGKIGSNPQDHQRDRLRKNWSSDNAVDIAVPYGTPVYAVQDGRIGSQFGPLNSSDPQLLGQRLHLLTSSNEYYYAHLSQMAPGIQPGVEVQRGDLLGWSGRAGGEDHLHFGVKNGDPEALVSSAEAYFNPKPAAPPGQPQPDCGILTRIASWVSAFFGGSTESQGEVAPSSGGYTGAARVETSTVAPYTDAAGMTGAERTRVTGTAPFTGSERQAGDSPGADGLGGQQEQSQTEEQQQQAQQQQAQQQQAQQEQQQGQQEQQRIQQQQEELQQQQQMQLQEQQELQQQELQQEQDQQQQEQELQQAQQQAEASQAEEAVRDGIEQGQERNQETQQEQRTQEQQQEEHQQQQQQQQAQEQRQQLEEDQQEHQEGQREEQSQAGEQREQQEQQEHAEERGGER